MGLEYWLSTISCVIWPVSRVLRWIGDQIHLPDKRQIVVFSLINTTQLLQSSKEWLDLITQKHGWEHRLHHLTWLWSSSWLAFPQQQNTQPDQPFPRQHQRSQTVLKRSGLWTRRHRSGCAVKAVALLWRLSNWTQEQSERLLCNRSQGAWQWKSMKVLVTLRLCPCVCTCICACVCICPCPCICPCLCASESRRRNWGSVKEINTTDLTSCWLF